MTRLQKKCLVAAAGSHLLVIVVVLCSGFIRPTPKVDNTTVLDVIPANIVEAELNSGVQHAQPPPPTPPTPTPPTPQQQVQPPTPTPPTPEPPKQQTFIEKIEKAITPDLTPVEKPTEDQPKPKPQKRQIEVNLKPVVRNVSQTTDTSAQEAKDAKKLRDERRKAFQAAMRNIKDNASSATTVDMPGSSSVSYASYGSVVRSVYDRAWKDPGNSANDESDVHISVTIASDGHVVESHIITPSGDAAMDSSVQSALDRVTFVAPFPEGASESQKIFLIDFNLKAKRNFE